MQLLNVINNFILTGPATKVKAQHLVGPFGRWSSNPQTDQQTGNNRHIYLAADPVFALTDQVSAAQHTFEPAENSSTDQR